MTSRLLAVLATALAYPNISAGQAVDPADALNAALAELRTYIVSRDCRTICDIPGAIADRGQCTPYSEPGDPDAAARNYSLFDPETTVNYLSKTELRDGCCSELRRECEVQRERLRVNGEVSLRLLGVEYATEVQESDPRAADALRLQWQNCTEATNSIERQISLSASQSDTISVGRTVSTSQELEAGFEVKLSFGTIGSTATISRTLDISRQRSSTETSSISRSTTISVEVLPQTFLIADSVLYEADGRLPFEITVLADAPVSANLEGVVHVSDVLSELGRTIVLEGRIDAVALSGLFVETYEGPLDCADEEAMTETIIR